MILDLFSDCVIIENQLLLIHWLEVDQLRKVLDHCIFGRVNNN